ncbi:MAG: hypothetical protein WBE18_04850, partial [Gammaproteobacteria bacterium]
MRRVGRAHLHADFYCCEKAIDDYNQAIELGAKLHVGDFFLLFFANLEPSTSIRFQALLKRIDQTTDVNLNCLYENRLRHPELLPYLVTSNQDAAVIECFLQKIDKKELTSFLQEHGLDRIKKCLDENKKLNNNEQREFKAQFYRIHDNVYTDEKAGKCEARAAEPAVAASSGVKSLAKPIVGGDRTAAAEGNTV